MVIRLKSLEHKNIVHLIQLKNVAGLYLVHQIIVDVLNLEVILVDDWELKLELLRVEKLAEVFFHHLVADFVVICVSLEVEEGCFRQ